MERKIRHRWVVKPDGRRTPRFEVSGHGVGLGEEGVDGGMQVDDGPEDAALEPSLVSSVKKPSTALSQLAEVGVRWNAHRGWRPSQARALGCW